MANQSKDETDSSSTSSEEKVEAGSPLEEATDKGYLGERTDPTPLDAYTLQGQNESNQAAEADANATSVARNQAAASADADAKAAEKSGDK